MTSESVPSGKCPECLSETTRRNDGTENCTRCSWWCEVRARPDTATHATPPAVDISEEAVERLQVELERIGQEECRRGDDEDVCDDARLALAALRRALTVAESDRSGFAATVAQMTREMQQMREKRWQPIETAPRDGTPILLGAGELAPDEDYDDGEVGAPTPIVGCWFRNGWYAWTSERHTWPTHWMPLPEHPTSPTGERA